MVNEKTISCVVGRETVPSPLDALYANIPDAGRGMENIPANYRSQNYKNKA